MTAQEHANAIWRAEPSPEALAGAISAYTDELRGELHRLTAENAALRESITTIRGFDDEPTEEIPVDCIVEDVRAVYAENAALKEEVTASNKRRDKAEAECNAVVAALKWTGDGYEWSPKVGDYREDPIAAVYRHAKHITDEIETARARIAELEGVARRSSDRLEWAIQFLSSNGDLDKLPWHSASEWLSDARAQVAANDAQAPRDYTQFTDSALSTQAPSK